MHLKVGERDPVVKRIRMMSDLGRGSVYAQCHKTKDMTAGELRDLHGRYRLFEDLSNDIDYLEARWISIAPQLLQEHPTWQSPPWDSFRETSGNTAVDGYHRYDRIEQLAESTAWESFLS